MNQTLPDSDPVQFIDAHPAVVDARGEILAGLQRAQKILSPKWFYDERGSQLFERITQLPEYYPTRAERGILGARQREIAAACGPVDVLVEPGCGSCEKVRLLLDSLRPAAFVAVDISADYLSHAAQQLAAQYPWLNVIAVCADFNSDWSFLGSLPPGRRVVFYPGSTIGNLEPDDAAAFLAQVAAAVGEGGGVIIGVDLHKSSHLINAAYNDGEGITAAFNLNVLERLNALLEADFEPGLFRHRAWYNESEQRLEMHLACTQSHTVRIGDSGIDFVAGETIHTENSYKYTIDGFATLAAQAGLALRRTWTDDDALFSVHYLQRT